MNWEIIRKRIVTSTQDVARDQPREGLVVVAETQTKGRGRRGSEWASSEGGLYMTIVLRNMAQINLISLLAGVAVSEGIKKSLSLPTEVKWPNDVLLHGKKVAGVIAESTWESGMKGWTFLGIGINANNELPYHLPNATNLCTHTSSKVDQEHLLHTLLESFKRLLHTLEKEPDRILDLWRALASTIGRRVRIVEDHESFTGLAINVDQDGALMVETEEGLRKVLSGSVLEL